VAQRVDIRSAANEFACGKVAAVSSPHFIEPLAGESRRQYDSDQLLMTLFSRIDTVIVRVRDVTRAVQWYTRTLGLAAVYSDPAEGLTVLGMEGTSLTLWQIKPHEGGTEPSGHSFPIFAVADAAAAHHHLVGQGATVEPLQEGPGVRFFTFHDLDGNRLEACQVMA
jgi:catechol 2,3-dioxygenase-like lactoylglutathione lyase family enzyme